MNANDAILSATAADPRHDPSRVIRAPRGSELLAKPKARAAIPETPAIRPAPSSISAAARPISNPPTSPASGAASGNPGRLESSRVIPR